MKIHFLTVIPSPYQRQLFLAISRLDGMDIHVSYYAGGAKDRDWKRPELNSFERVLRGKSFELMRGKTFLNFEIVRELKRVDADLVVISDYSALTAQIAMRFLSAKNRPWVFWGEVPGFNRRGFMGNWLRRRLQSPLKKSNAIVAIGKNAQAVYKDLYPEKPVLNIPYFCDLAPYLKARKRRGYQRHGTLKILFCGQLIERKGLDVLVAALEKLTKDHSSFELLIAGSGPLKRQYLSSLNESISDKVRFLGHRDPDDLPLVFADTDIFCLPSRHDGWGVVVNEALGAGLPIVVSEATGAAHDLVEDGRNGFITETDNVDALYGVLRELTLNEDKRQSQGKASTHKAKNWSLGSGAKMWETAATELLQAK